MSQGKTFTAACVQMTAGREIAPNIAMASALIREARDKGAELIVTPENTTMMEPARAAILEKAQPEAGNESLAAFRKLAAELEVWLVIGSLTVKLDGDICANRQFVIAPDGRVAARYDKIHMFDVQIPDGQSYRESATFTPGERAVVTPLPWGKLGLSICYDIRFPYLYRALAHGGAEFITAPAAFTRFTGEAHWHVLQRARAIETGCFVIAAAQCGTHAEKRETFGHSLIVAPWGEVLADGGTEPGVVLAEIDPARVAKARSMIPALTHDRDFAGPAAAETFRAAGE